MRKRKRKPGVSNTPEYTTWSSAKQRCQNPKAPGYKYYGGRGIEMRFDTFDGFLAELGLRPSPDHTLDRINNDGHYKKGNVRWATPEEQARNRSNNVVDEETADKIRKRYTKGCNMAELGREFGVTRDVVHYIVKKGGWA